MCYLRWWAFPSVGGREAGAGGTGIWSWRGSAIPPKNAGVHGHLLAALGHPLAALQTAVDVPASSNVPLLISSTPPSLKSLKNVEDMTMSLGTGR